MRIQSEEGLNSSIKKIQGGIAVLEDYKPPRQPEISQKLPEAKTKERKKKKKEEGCFRAGQQESAHALTRTTDA